MEKDRNFEMSQVDQPPHYKGFPKQTWEMMIDIWGKENFITYCQINAFKYKMRAGDKPNEPAEKDLAKARWYLNKIKELEAQ